MFTNILLYAKHFLLWHETIPLKHIFKRYLLETHLLVYVSICSTEFINVRNGFLKFQVSNLKNNIKEN